MVLSLDHDVERLGINPDETRASFEMHMGTSLLLNLGFTRWNVSKLNAKIYFGIHLENFWDYSLTFSGYFFF